MQGPHGTTVVGMLAENPGSFGCTYLTLFYNENRKYDQYNTGWWVPGSDSWYSGEYFDAENLNYATRRLIERYLRANGEVIYAP
jgi:hypothetical protein